MTLSTHTPSRGQKRLELLVLLVLLGIGSNVTFLLVGVVQEQPTQQLALLDGTTAPAPPEAEENTPASQKLIHRLHRTHALTAAQVKDLFKGGPSRSLVSRVVGTAEGTRFADGSKTIHWYGHEDPGDKLWNYGTFSYSFVRHGVDGPRSPERADKIYFQQILGRVDRMIAQVERSGQALSLEEWLNFIDLRNQAPEAALGWRDGLNPGYVVNLQAVEWQGAQGQTAIIRARVESFRNQQTGHYEAWTNRSGLIRDQARRSDAIRSTLAIWQRQMNGIEPVSLPDLAIKRNPYNAKVWTRANAEQKTSALYWQQGALDAANGLDPVSQDFAYLKGYHSNR